MRKTRLLLVNEPLSYRDAIAHVFRELRPNLEVLACDPDDVESGLEALAPDVVICSALTPAIRDGVRVWIELYPGGEPLAVVSIAGERATFSDIELPDLLSVVDSTTEILQHNL
ncbi:MAG TPA: hypothetical protein VFJ72_14745 [Rubrobacteraceae bacterium]|nr:hypothetical protein [Rubrobacteraceae bacterium]